MAKLCIYGGLVLALVFLFTIACKPKPTPTPTPTPGLLTIGRLAEGGRTIFTTICSKCHGERGQGGVIGPAIIGTNATLEKFETAKGLFTYISIAMPFDAPGSLTQQQYLEDLSFLLLQNNFVTSETTLDPDNLESLPLKK